MCIFAVILAAAYAKVTIERDKYDEDGDREALKNGILEADDNEVDTEEIEVVRSPKTTYTCASGWKCGGYKKTR